MPVVMTFLNLVISVLRTTLPNSLASALYVQLARISFLRIHAVIALVGLVERVAQGVSIACRLKTIYLNVACQLTVLEFCFLKLIQRLPLLSRKKQVEVDEARAIETKHIWPPPGETP